jgi:beta-mannosidase
MTAFAPGLKLEHLLSIPLDCNWEVACASDPVVPEDLATLHFAPAQVPGTVASALREQSKWHFGAGIRFDAGEYWFRQRFEASPVEQGEELVLQIDGIATLAEVWLNGQKILSSNSMFASHTIEVSRLIRKSNELLIVCRALVPALRAKRRQAPAARWRTRVVAEQQLRCFRTTLLGRAPGFAPEPEPVGPWRPITLIRRRHIVLEDWTRQVVLDGPDGLLRVHLRLRALEMAGTEPVSAQLWVGSVSSPLEIQESRGEYQAQGIVRLPNVVRWWPHTHGEPALYPVRVELALANGSCATFEDVPVGFRQVEIDRSGAGLTLNVNGTAVFCRGVVWTPLDAVSLAAPAPAVRRRLQLLRDAGFNLIRVAGTTFYQDAAFLNICDELGLLVWQDMMFANMDYPFEAREFLETARAEAECELSRLGRHASLAVVCGNSEVEQQVGMLGLNPALGRGDWFGRELPDIAARHCPGVPYVPSAPSGGDMPFRTRSGVANYFGVGAYMRPLEDARRAEVSFASECLALSNIPEPEMISAMSLATPGGTSPTHPAWKRAVPRDSGAGWDFEDIRDHYFKLLYAADPMLCRSVDPARYWELSRTVSGEVMAEVFGEWRRKASPCGGGIILWSADLEPGAGWGILDSTGTPKAAYWYLKRALAARAVWTTDEGLNGVDIHVANDGSTPLAVWLRVALYKAGEQCVGQSEIFIDIPEHTTSTLGVEEILGRFVDAAYAYRFGPPGHDLLSVSMRENRDGMPLAQAFRFPAGRTTQRSPIADLGIAGEGRQLADGTIEVRLTTRRFAWGVRLASQGFMPEDAYFGIEPGGERRIVMIPTGRGDCAPNLTITAINGEGHIPIAIRRGA